MVPYAPSNASGVGGRGRSATAKDISFMNEFTKNYIAGGTNVLAANQPTPILTPHIDPFLQIIICCNGNRSDQHQARDGEFPPHPRPSSIVSGSLWAETQALRSFRDQLRQFDRGTCNFLERT
jgi:hypothetical protein